jgi:hypothetical protein
LTTESVPASVASTAVRLLGTYSELSASSGVAGELRYEQIGSNTYVQGDGVADFWILMDGLHTMTGSDFIL